MLDPGPLAPWYCENVILQNRKYVTYRSEKDRAMATGNMCTNLVKCGRVELCERTDRHCVRSFIRSDRSRAICPGTVSFLYYVRVIHSAFFNTRRDCSDCSDFRRSSQLHSVRVAMLVYLIFWRQNDIWIILMKITYLQCILLG